MTNDKDIEDKAAHVEKLADDIGDFLKESEGSSDDVDDLLKSNSGKKKPESILKSKDDTKSVIDKMTSNKPISINDDSKKEEAKKTDDVIPTLSGSSSRQTGRRLKPKPKDDKAKELNKDLSKDIGNFCLIFIFDILRYQLIFEYRCKERNQTPIKRTNKA